MSLQRVLETNVQELNHMYYDQLKRVAALSEQNARYKRIIKELVESLSVGEPVSLVRLSEIREEIE